jgi:hypothetical protein
MFVDEFEPARDWLPWIDVADLFDAFDDPAWTVDRDRMDHTIGEPWEGRDGGRGQS